MRQSVPAEYYTVRLLGGVATAIRRGGEFAYVSVLVAIAAIGGGIAVNSFKGAAFAEVSLAVACYAVMAGVLAMFQIADRHAARNRGLSFEWAAGIASPKILDALVLLNLAVLVAVLLSLL